MSYFFGAVSQSAMTRAGGGGPPVDPIDADWATVIALYDTRITPAFSGIPLVRASPTRFGLQSRGNNATGMFGKTTPIAAKFNAYTDATQTGTGFATLNYNMNTNDLLRSRICMEGWVYFKSTYDSSSFGAICSLVDVYTLRIDGVNGVRFMWRLTGDASYPTGQVVSIPLVDVPRDEWFYVAATRDASGVMRIYLNGVLKDTSSAVATSDILNPSTYILTFGAETTVGGSPMSEDKGHIEDWRISAVERYTGSTHPVPTAIHPRGTGGDPHWSNVVLLIDPSLSGGNAPGRELSWRTHPIEATTNVNQIKTVDGPFKSFYPSSVAGVLSAASITSQYRFGANADFNFRGVEWTVEFHTYYNTSSAPSTGDRGGVSHYAATNGQRQWAVGFNGRAPKATVSENGTAEATIVGSALNDFQWYHIALTRDASKVVRLFVDGVLVGSTTLTDDLFDVTRQMQVFSYGASRGQLDRLYDSVRITRGVCRYDANFTPPVAPFPLYP
jgi:hypothetical protein